MSFSVYLHEDACPHCGRGDGAVWEWEGMTYNLTPMFRLAGFYDRMLSLANVSGTFWFEKLRGEAHGPVNPSPGTASDLRPLLAHALSDMVARPEVYRERNPPNGWGCYEDALEFVQAFHDACARWPGARIKWSG